MKITDQIGLYFFLTTLLVTVLFLATYYKIDKSEKKIEEIHHLLVDKVEK